MSWLEEMERSFPLGNRPDSTALYRRKLTLQEECARAFDRGMGIPLLSLAKRKRGRKLGTYDTGDVLRAKSAGVLRAYDEGRLKRKFSDEQIAEICRRSKAESIDDLAREFGMSRGYAYKVAKRGARNVAPDSTRIG